MRKKLDDFCQGQLCDGKCVLSSPVCRCGNGAYFTRVKGHKAYMTDDEIIDAYNLVFDEAKEIEEKRDILLDYCRSVSCKQCILNNESHKWKIECLMDKCLDIYDSDEEDLDKALDLILTKDLNEAHDTDKLKEALSYSVNDPSSPNMIREKLGFPPYKVNDSVNSPSHYTDGKIEVIDYIEDKKLGFCLGNAIKYISRAGKKDKDKEAEDINKAIWYLNRYLKQLEEA